MNPQLQILARLEENAQTPLEKIAEELHIPLSEVRATIADLERQKIILGYKTIVDEDKLDRNTVKAIINVKTTPERGEGFDRLARRISQYPEVIDCYLVSGDYDLVIFVQAPSSKAIAHFVAEKLSTLTGIVSTATHFLLKTYKEHHIPFFDTALAADDEEDYERLKISP
ncbi:MAG: Lrp/AsnC family transcriptional regulator [Methylacidiphilales bacterium]|nr:Lrp/AsnC family transcriptional regulator [Candidatus Methylacidiphilales bacterium]MDW8348821.1 Lrp/AsnC family transcriptional regulator [Verrucomicrobiae bacterium]